MDLSIRIEVFQDGLVREDLTPELDRDGKNTYEDLQQLMRLTLITTANTVLKEEQSKGFDKKPVTVVDNRAGKPVDNVRPFGTIEFLSRQNLGEILLQTYARILTLSPEDTGQYMRSNLVFLNGTQVASSLGEMANWLKTATFSEKDLIRFINIQPYARKLERLGVTGRRQQSRTVKSRNKRRASQGVRVLAPNGTYFLTTRAIKSKYKNNASIKFEFISGSQLGIGASFKAKNGKAGRPYLYPSITIAVSESGIL